MPVPNMKAKPPRPNEEPYAGKLLVRFREGLGRRLPSLLDKKKKDTGILSPEDFEEAARETSNFHYALRLFVTGMSPRSLEAIENVRNLCEKHLKGRYSLEVIDLYQHPELASQNQVLAAPTLIKRLPLPLRKFVGNMTKTSAILAGLDLKIQEKKQ